MSRPDDHEAHTAAPSRDRKGMARLGPLPHGRGSVLLVLIIVGFVLAMSSCSRISTRAAGKRMIVLGIDGMDPTFLEHHWDALPNLDRLRRQGDFKRLATTIPPQSPVAWSTLITGMDAGGHGIFDFIHREPATITPFSSMAEVRGPGRALRLGSFTIPFGEGRVRTLRMGKAFWQILSENGVPTTVVRMPVNFPPVESKARSLSGMGTPDMQGTFGTFTFFTDDPQERGRRVPGGRIVRVQAAQHRAILLIEGPVNPFRNEQPRSTVQLTLDVDPGEAVARLELGETQAVLREGEWSGWLKAHFPIIPGLKNASGMVRVYLQSVRPHLRLYVTPINLDPAAPELPISTPRSYSQELAEALGPYYTQGIPEDTAALRAGIFSRAEFLAQSRQVLEDSLRAFRYELDRFNQGLLFFYFSSIDQNSHVLWGKYDSKLLEIYQATDRAVGMAMAEAPDTTLMILSDHGFAAFNRAVHLNSWLLQEGFLALDDPANTGDEELFPHVDWSKTQVFALGLNGLYLNQRGREPHGIVAPGAERDAVLKKLAERLRTFRDPENGELLVDTVYVPYEVFHGDSLKYAPDLIVGYRPGYRASWQTALGAVPKTVVEDNNEAWIGDHCIAARYVPGVLLSNRKVRDSEPHLYDLTATILNEFGIRPGQGMIGRAIY